MAEITVVITIANADTKSEARHSTLTEFPCWNDLARMLGMAIRGIDSDLCGDPIDDAFGEQLEESSGLALLPKCVQTVRNESDTETELSNNTP